MSPIALCLILTSIIFHASWNMLAKKHRISIPYYAIIYGVCMLMFGNVLFWTPLRYCELPAAFWSYLVASTLSDILYCNALVYSYKNLEMSSAYPIMRALPVIFTTIVTNLAGWGTDLTVNTVLGFLIVFLGALIIPMKKLSDFKISNYINASMLFVILGALGITGYTVFDSQAQNVLRSVFPDIRRPMQSISYYAIRMVLQNIFPWTVVLVSAKNRSICMQFWKDRDWAPVLTGLFAGLTYPLILVAMNYVTNVTFVQVFRQLGLPVGMLFGILFLKEKNNLTKWIGVTLILTGLVISVLNS